MKNPSTFDIQHSIFDIPFLPFLLLLTTLAACSPAEKTDAPEELPTTLTAQDAGNDELCAVLESEFPELFGRRFPTDVLA